MTLRLGWEDPTTVRDSSDDLAALVSKVAKREEENSNSLLERVLLGGEFLLAALWSRGVLV